MPRAKPILFEDMLAAALAARSNAYIPVSGFAVGAALLSGANKIYAGCNIEDAAFNSSLHAEQTAIAHMRVAEGSQAFIKVIVVVADGLNGAPVMPCGHCRQFIGEFIHNLKQPVPVRTYNSRGELTGSSTWQKLLPQAFSGRAFIK